MFNRAQITLGLTGLLAMALSASLVVACGPSPPSSIVASIGEPFQLAYGQTAQIPQEGLDLTFERLVEDSRCPQGATCVWQGNAGVVVLVSDDAIQLNTALEPRQASYLGYTIELLAVEPYPKLGEQYAPEDYTITLVVTHG